MIRTIRCGNILTETKACAPAWKREWPTRCRPRSSLFVAVRLERLELSAKEFGPRAVLCDAEQRTKRTTMGDAKGVISGHLDIGCDSYTLPVSASDRHPHSSVWHDHLETRIHWIGPPGVCGAGRPLAHDLAAIAFSDEEREPFISADGGIFSPTR
jgi:hypothetical protein